MTNETMALPPVPSSIPKTIQILTNLNCNLACTYCYENKNKGKNDLDSILNFLRVQFKKNEGFDKTVEFIGGESFMYPEILDAVMTLSEELKGDTSVNYGISSNGTLITTEKVQDFILKWRNKLQIGISIDGTKDIHDNCRIYAKDGRGSYDDAVAGLRWLQRNIHPDLITVKATFNRETLPRYSEAVIHLIELGFTKIGANAIYEDFYTLEDGAIMLREFMALADYLIDNNLNEKVEIFQLNRYLDMTLNLSLNPRFDDRNYCGTCSHMACIGFNDKVYGCNRFCTMDKADMEIGVLEGEVIVPKNEQLMSDVIGLYKYFKQECGTCKLLQICPSCSALPYELFPKEDVSQFYKEKRMCMWTHALALAKTYMYFRTGGTINLNQGFNGETGGTYAPSTEMVELNKEIDALNVKMSEAESVEEKELILKELLVLEQDRRDLEQKSR